MANLRPIQSFNEFRKSLSSAKYDEFKSRQEVNVESEDAFEEMRHHIMDLYEDVEVRHSFLESAEHVVDCIPVEQQPSLRKSGQKPLAPPTMRLAPVDSSVDVRDSNPSLRKAPPPQLHPDFRDSLGNQMWCPDGTIPIMRTTLEQASRFKNLHSLLRGGSADSSKRHAKGGQTIDNLGGSSIIDVWQPPVFGVQNSASQQWYSTPDAPFVTWQSVECGWRVGTPYPPFDLIPRLFVFYTANNYVPPLAYNHLAPGFVQSDPRVLLGGVLPVPQPGGEPSRYQMGFFLTGNAWWFHFEGVWVGSYPTSLFGGGYLASRAGLASFGGETSGIGAFPPMGSGAFPTLGLGRVASQRNIFITPVGGPAQAANLTPGPQFPSCYNTRIENSSSSGSGTDLFFGGPGGIGCS